jgi:hypothetical protein
MYLCVVCGSENKQRLFLCTGLTDDYHTAVVLRGERAETIGACAVSGFIYGTDINVLRTFCVLLCLLTYLLCSAGVFNAWPVARGALCRGPPAVLKK